MQRKLLEKLCCPFDKNDLEISVFNESDDQDIYEGLLTCTECQRYYPIVYSIPIMTPDEYRERKLELPILDRWGLAIDESKNSFILDDRSQSKMLEHKKQ